MKKSKKVLLAALAATTALGVTALAAPVEDTDLDALLLNLVGKDAATINEAGDGIKIGIGQGANAGGEYSMGIGYKAKALGVRSVALGSEGTAAADYSLALMDYANAGGEKAISIGYKATSSQESSIAIGSESSAVKDEVIAIGANSRAGGDNSMAIGAGATANAINSIVMGKEAVVADDAEGAMALGVAADVKVAGGIALGTDSVADRAAGNAGYLAPDQNEESAWTATGAALSVGGQKEGADAVTRQIINVAAGTEDTDVVNVAQLKAAQTRYVSITDDPELAPEDNYYNDGATGKRAIAIGPNAVASGNQTVAIGNMALAKQSNSTVIGHNNIANSWGATAIGNKNRAGEFGSNGLATAIGAGNHSTAQHGVAMGIYNRASGFRSLAIGIGNNDDREEFNEASGAKSVALGYMNNAAGEASFAGGSKAQATADNAIALGTNANANIADAIALGAESVTVADAGEEGYFAQQQDTGSAWVSTRAALAIGDAENDVTRQITGVAAGTQDTDAVNLAQLKKVYEMQLNMADIHYFSYNDGGEHKGNWDNTGAYGIDSIAIGMDVEALKEKSIAIGNGNIVDSWGAIAFGLNNEAGLDGSKAMAIAMGAGNYAEAERAIAFGVYNKATGKNSMAIGVGEGNIEGYYNQADGENAIALGSMNKAGGDNSLAIGANSQALQAKSTAIGSGNIANSWGATAIGVSNQAGAAGMQGMATAIGAGNEAAAKAAVAMGVYSRALGEGSVVLGTGEAGNASTAIGDYSLALGYANRAEAKLSTALGANAVAATKGGVALGANTVADRDSMVRGFDPLTNEVYELNEEQQAAYDAYAQALIEWEDDMENADKEAAYLAAKAEYRALVNTWESGAGAVSVGDAKTGLTRQITGVAAGSEDTDAVNVAQLKVIETELDEVTTEVGRLDGRIDAVDERLTTEVERLDGEVERLDGEVVRVEQKFDGEVERLDGEVVRLDEKIDANKVSVLAGDNIEVTANETETEYTVALAKDINVTSVTADKVTAGTVQANAYQVGDVVYIDENGINANNKVISNVAAGVAPTDAANMAQLQQVSDHVAHLGRDVNDLRDESREGDAMGMALAALKPLQYDPYNRSQILAGVGGYRGQHAVALGLAHYTNEDTMLHAGLAYAGDSHMAYNVGVSWRFGSNDERLDRVPERYAEGPISSIYVMQEEMDRVIQENEAQREIIEELQRRLEALEAKQ